MTGFLKLILSGKSVRVGVGAHVWPLRLLMTSGMALESRCVVETNLSYHCINCYFESFQTVVCKCQGIAVIKVGVAYERRAGLECR